MIASVFGAMTYAAQSHLNAIGRSDREAYLEKRLSGEQLTAALVQRGAWSGLIPQFADTGADLLGFDPVFDTRSSGTQSSFLDNPSFDLVKSTKRAAHGITRAAREGDWSQGEARSLARVLPFQNMLPAVMLLNEFVSRMPEHAPKKD